MQAKNNWFKDSANLFVIQIVFVYAVWKLFSYYQKHSAGWVHEAWQKIVLFLGGVYATVVSTLLNIFGENTSHSGINIFYPLFNKTIRVEDHCLAIPATIIFVGSILLFKGPWKAKRWFIPFGVIVIILINLIRLIFICEAFVYFTQPYFDINHNLVFVCITYGLIFAMIIWWMKKYANAERQPGNSRTVV